MNEIERKGVRALFKTVMLGIQYGLGARSLAVRTGISISEAAEILARLRSRFYAFEDYARSVLDHAGLKLEIGTPFGWFMQCPSGINSRTVRNFPIQSTGSEILHVACILAERRRIGVDERPFSPLPRRQRRHLRYHRIADEIRLLESRLVSHLDGINRDLQRRIRVRKSKGKW